MFKILFVFNAHSCQVGLFKFCLVFIVFSHHCILFLFCFILSVYFYFWVRDPFETSKAHWASSSFDLMVAQVLTHFWPRSSPNTSQVRPTSRPKSRLVQLPRAMHDLFFFSHVSSRHAMAPLHSAGNTLLHTASNWLFLYDHHAQTKAMLSPAHTKPAQAFLLHMLTPPSGHAPAQTS